MKTCSCCGLEKPREDFQVRKASCDGLTASCKDCLKKRDAKRYPKEKERRALLNKAYMQTLEGKESHARSVAEWQDRNRLRRAANVILGNAVKYGKVSKLPCFMCGRLDVEGHHPNYDAPLDVIWLCVEHHKEIHFSVRDGHFHSAENHGKTIES